MLKNTIDSIDDFIVGEKFYSLADFVYAPDIEPEFDDYNILRNTFDITKLKDKNIIYTHTLYIKILFYIIKDLDAEFLIITHNSDINIEDTFIIPDNVKYWFSQNVNFKHYKLISIPIGLENGKWFRELDKKKKIFNKTKEKKKIKNLVYVNHNITTNFLERSKPYKILDGKKYITFEYGKNGCEFDKYIDNIYNHKFMICPDGNGIDTHRVWECLYLNTIPIQIKNINNQFYTDLPICFIDKWQDLSREFLEWEYKRIINNVWNFKKLKMKYWEILVKQTFESMVEI
jgi:hypothetical protein